MPVLIITLRVFSYSSLLTQKKCVLLYCCARCALLSLLITCLIIYSSIYDMAIAIPPIIQRIKIVYSIAADETATGLATHGRRNDET